MLRKGLKICSSTAGRLNCHVTQLAKKLHVPHTTQEALLLYCLSAKVGLLKAAMDSVYAWTTVKKSV